MMPVSPSKKRQHIAQDKNGGDDARDKHKIAFIPNSLLTSSSLEVVKLRNPHTQAASSYLIDKETKTVHEIMAFDEGNRCWFIGETVESNGKLYLITPMDATYLILPYLMKAERVMPLGHVLEDEVFPDLACLEPLLTDKNFSHVAERKGSPELCAWRYKEDKTLLWLSGRVERLATFLHSKKMPTSPAHSLTYITHSDMQQAKEAYLSMAHGIISEYLPKDLAKCLHTHLKLPEKKPKTQDGFSSSVSKKQKVEGPTEDYAKDSVVPTKGKAAMTAKEKALAKSAAGSKSILSFFAKK